MRKVIFFSLELILKLGHKKKAFVSSMKNAIFPINKTPWFKGIIVFVRSKRQYIASSFSPLCVALKRSNLIGIIILKQRPEVAVTMAVPDKVNLSLLLIASFLSVSVIGRKCSVRIFHWLFQLVISQFVAIIGNRVCMLGIYGNFWTISSWSFFFCSLARKLKLFGLLCCWFLISRWCCPRLKCSYAPFHGKLKLIVFWLPPSLSELVLTHFRGEMLKFWFGFGISTPSLSVEGK